MQPAAHARGADARPLAAIDDAAPPLRCPPAEVKRAGPGNLPGVVWRQWRVERALKTRGVDFRSDDPAAVAAAYEAMTAAEFDAINGRQAWANWRTIPASLDGLAPNRPLAALDLGCGTGGSTAVLAWLLPGGSDVTGVEFAAPLAAVARTRDYPHRGGEPRTVRFVVGSACGSWPADDASLDLVNASGVIGHHLSGADLSACLDEAARALRPGGVAALDPGPTASARTLIEGMTARGFRFERRTRSNPFDRCGQVVCVKSP